MLFLFSLLGRFLYGSDYEELSRRSQHMQRRRRRRR